jgi:hypothetical protein
MRPRKKYANQHTFVRNCGKLAYKISRLYCQRKKYAGGYKSGILGKILGKIQVLFVLQKSLLRGMGEPNTHHLLKS